MAAVKIQVQINKPTMQRNGSQGSDNGLQKGKKEAAFTAVPGVQKQVAVSTQSLSMRGSAMEIRPSPLNLGTPHNTLPVQQKTFPPYYNEEINAFSLTYLDVGKRRKYQMEIYIQNTINGRLPPKKEKSPGFRSIFKILSDEGISAATLMRSTCEKAVVSIDEADL